MTMKLKRDSTFYYMNFLETKFFLSNGSFDLNLILVQTTNIAANSVWQFNYVNKKLMRWDLFYELQRRKIVIFLHDVEKPRTKLGKEVPSNNFSNHLIFPKKEHRKLILIFNIPV